MGAAAPIISAVIGAGASIYQQDRAEKKQASAQRKALEQAQAQTKRQEDADAQAYNRANQKDAVKNSVSGQGNYSGTMLTGPQGITNDLSLGKNTLLGQ